VDSKGNPLKLKLYPPLKNAVKGVYLAKGGNILEYRVKANALLKPRSNHPSTTLALQPVQNSKHKHKKEKTMPLDIHKKVQEDFVLVHKKYLMKHGHHVVKQVLKPKKILKHTVSLEPMTREISQHGGIGLQLFYLNMQHCNVSLSFDKIKLIIVKHSQNINLIFSVQLKSNPY